MRREIKTSPTQGALEVQSLCDRLLHMGLKVQAMISGSMRALAERNSQLAMVLIAADHDVNRLELSTDQMCLRILARRQPVASELRTVASCVKMVTDLERIGDLAVHICEQVLRLDAEPVHELDTELWSLGEHAQGMVRDALSAFRLRDAQAARRVVQQDAQVGACFDRVFRRSVQVMIEDTNELLRVHQLQSVATRLRQIGDHAKNLAQMVIFMVEGRDVRHLPAATRSGV
ncbi:MAG TPA: phosphate signaling complex protein PhoU [Polyangiales bacterium]